MELLKMPLESVIPRKRRFEDIIKRRTVVPAVRDFPPGCGINEAERKPSKILKKAHSDIGKMTSHGGEKLVDSNHVGTDKFNTSKPIELGRNKPSSAVIRPPGKVKLWEPACTKAGYDQKPKVTTTHGPQRKVFNNVDSDVRKMTPDEKDKLVSSCPVENSKLKSFAPKELGRSKSYVGSRPTSKVKFYDPRCEEAQKPEDTNTIVSPKELKMREQIKEAMTLFDQVYEQVHQEKRSRPYSEKTPCWEAAKIVKQKLKWAEPGKVVGHVCGVQIGDKFRYRSQLMMVGLHNQAQSGIDFANIDGKSLAISIVDAHRYSNESGSSDTLIYSGQGGLDLFGYKHCKSPPEDQKLEKGNLALKNSMDMKKSVRVIRKVEWFGKEAFVYDGFYTVEKCTSEKSSEGKNVFKFHLKRVPGQPSLQKMLKW